MRTVDSNVRLRLYGRRCIDLVSQRIQTCNSEIAHRGLKRFVPKHELNCSDGNLFRFPIAGTSFTKPMQVVMLSDSKGTPNGPVN